MQTTYNLMTSLWNRRRRNFRVSQFQTDTAAEWIKGTVWTHDSKLYYRSWIKPL